MIQSVPMGAEAATVRLSLGVVGVEARFGWSLRPLAARERLAHKEDPPERVLSVAVAGSVPLGAFTEMTPATAGRVQQGEPESRHFNIHSPARRIQRLLEDHLLDYSCR